MNNKLPYERCNEYLAQGDIFAIPLIAPYAEDEIRIFRSTNGLPGYKVFESEGLEGRIFDYKGLIEILNCLPKNEQMLPFHHCSEDPHEMVLVHADLLDFFVLVSQTCDVSGIDSKPKPFVSVLPFVPLANFLSREKLPIGDNEKETAFPESMTIVEYLECKLKINFKEHKNNPYKLPYLVYERIRNWNPPKKSNDKKIRNAIRQLLTNFCSDKLYTYYLPNHEDLGVPEGIVDFCRLYTLPITTINDLKKNRVATISSPYRENFAQKLATYLGRIATPSPISPPKI